MNTATTALTSATHFTALVFHGNLHLCRSRLGHAYSIKNGTYRIFRETDNTSSTDGTTVLVIGFRLKLVGSNPVMHWLFQRICILSTPFWSGMAGFKTKLWMVDPHHKNYIGVYDWQGRDEAHAYVSYLLPILRFCSVSKTVWADELQATNFEAFLDAHQAATGKRKALVWHT